MNQLLPYLPQAVTVAIGSILCANGYRGLHNNTTTIGIFLLSGLGALTGFWMQSMVAAIALALVGTGLAYTLNRYLSRVYIAMAAAGAGYVVGLVTWLLTTESFVRLAQYSPRFVCIASAIAFGLLALIDGRIISILWTSAGGACLSTLGFLGAIRSTATILSSTSSEISQLRPNTTHALILLGGCFVVGIVTQWVLTRGQTPKRIAAHDEDTPPARKRSAARHLAHANLD